MMAHLGYVPPQVFQIDPSLLAISPYIDPLPSITANATSPPPPPKRLKRKAAEGITYAYQYLPTFRTSLASHADLLPPSKILPRSPEGKGDTDKPKKPRKKPVRTPRPKSASPTNGDGTDALLPIGALAAANTLGRHTKLACTYSDFVENVCWPFLFADRWCPQVKTVVLAKVRSGNLCDTTWSSRKARQTHRIPRAAKCSRHTRCLSCIARGEECVWADGPPTLEQVLPPSSLQLYLLLPLTQVSFDHENRTPKPSSALEVEAHRLHRLVKILSARCAAREALLATRLGRPPRAVPTLADIPIAPPPPVQLPPPPPKSSKREKQQADKSQRERGGGGGGEQPSRDDIVVDFQAYNDYCNRHSANQESILEDAQALLSLAVEPVKSGTGSPFFVDDNVDPGQGIQVGVGLEISAAAALAAAQAARQPLPFSQFMTSSSAATAQRPPLARSATTSALLHHNGGVPPTTTTPYAAPTADDGTVITATQIEAYRSLAAQMGLDLNDAAGGSPDPYDGGADQAFDSSAFGPVMESTVLPPPPLYYLPPPIPSATATTAAASETRSASAASTATFFYPTLGAPSSSSQSSDPNAAAPGRRRQDPEWLSEREARHRARFDRAANEALTTMQEQEDEEPVSKNASGGLFRSQGYGYGRAYDHINNNNNNNDNRDDDPMLLAPIETRHLPHQQPPSPPPPPPLPARRSSWLLSPILDPLSLPVPPSSCSSSSIMQQQQQQQQRRPHLSIDAAGAFAQTFREANPLSGSGNASGGGGVGGGGAGGGGGGGGGAISALFWRGLPSAATPLRSAFAAAGTTTTNTADAEEEAAGLRPFGSSKIRLWQDIVIDSPADLLQDDDDDDDNDERFEPRPAGGNTAAAEHSLMMMMSASGGGGGVLDEWERFQPRAANQTERTAADWTVVEEREPEEQEPEEQEQEQEGEGDRGKDGSVAATGAEEEEEEEEELVAAAAGGSPQTSAAAAVSAVSVGAMEAAVDGGGSTRVGN